MIRLWLFNISLLPLLLVAEEPDPLKILADGNATFGFELVQQVEVKDKSFCLSPFNIASCLILPYLGAKENTAKQMKEKLHFSLKSPELEKSWSSLLQYLTQHPSNYSSSFRLLTAQSLWIQNRQRILSEYMIQVRKTFSTQVYRVDFTMQGESARSQINRWVAGQTNNKITNLIGEKAISAATKMVAVAALYLKAKWATPFSSRTTFAEPFFPTEKKTLSLPMMHQTAFFSFFENDTLQLLEMPLEKPGEGGPELSMVFVLPKERTGVSEVVQMIGSFNEWIAGAKELSVNVTLPKFKVHSSLSLSSALQALGMTDPFTEAADFSGISGSKDLFISDVFTQVYVDVEEGGVEATAATGATMNTTAVRNPMPAKVFKADHPFIFILRDRKTGVILFLGQFVEN